jgi:hypothetical protein
MALTTELKKIHSNLILKVGRTVPEENLLRELNALNANLLNESARSIEANVQKMTGSGSGCACCGRS